MDTTPVPIATREKILQVALEMFAEQGYQHTTVREIAERVGITKAAVHYHFARKIDIILDIAEPVWRDIETIIEAAETAPEPGWYVLEHWLDAVLKYRRVFQILTHDPAMLSDEVTYARVLTTGARAVELVAGPDPTPGDRVRAAQALGMLGDPIYYFPDMPEDVLREETLKGVRRLLGESTPAAWNRSTEATHHGRNTGPPAEGVTRHISKRRRPGRPSALTAEGRLRVRRLHAEGRSADEIAVELGVSRATIYRHLST